MTTPEQTLDRMTRERAIEELITPNGKQLRVYHVSNTALYKVAFESGGELPEELDGMFTDVPRAQDAAQRYLKRKWDEAEKEPDKSKGGRPRKEQQSGEQAAAS